MTTRPWIRQLLTRTVTRTIRNAPRRARPVLEALEVRYVPSTFTVNSTADNGSGSGLVGDLRYCITQANLGNADTIAFDGTVFSTPRTITLTGGPLTLTDTDTTTISGPGAGLLSISGNNTSRVFTIDHGSANLSGLTITGGKAVGTGTDGEGGGLFNDHGSVTLSNITIRDNSAAGGGGGLFTSSGTTTLTSTTVSGNAAGSGGGVYNLGGTTTLTNATVSGNSARNGVGFKGATGVDGFIPPDTNAAVGGLTESFVVETVNDHLTVFDKNSGAPLLSQGLNSFFAPTGHTSDGDVYVVWDPLASRWYVDSIDHEDNASLLFAISNDDNPLHGFSTQFVVPSAASGDVTDFPKFGYNADSITFSSNDIGDGHAMVTVIDKAAALAGSLVDVQLTPSFNFRALVPAQQVTAHTGDPIWFTASPYLNQGSTSNAIRVTKLTDPFGAPVFIDYSVTVDTYGGYAALVDQPGGPGTVQANDNTTTQVFDYNDTLVAAFPASTAADGYLYPKAHYYTVDVSSGTPSLTMQGVVDPGPGVATFFPSATMNPSTGDLGLTWMQSSTSEYVSMYVGTVLRATGKLATYDAAPGQAYEQFSSRNGDYSTVVYDPVTNSFWAANEYDGADNGIVLWDTWIQQFSSSFSNVSGGGLYNLGGTTTLTNATVSGNFARFAGGIDNASGTFIPGNALVAANTAFSGPDAQGTFASQGNNLIGATDGSSGWVGSDLTGTAAHPLDPLLAPLGNYGGPTQTMALDISSPAVDGGNNANIPPGVTTDQRGKPRIFHGTVDIGAYESQVSFVPSFVVNTTSDAVNYSDGSITSLREAITFANRIPGGHVISFNNKVFMTPQVITLRGSQLELSNPSKKQTITGPKEGVTVNAGGASRVFAIDGGVTASISGLTITGGSASGIGGGVYNEGGNVTLTNCTVSGNAALLGGGVGNLGTATLTNCTVSGNAAFYGGGVGNLGTATLTNCTVSGNAAFYGGGLYNYGMATLNKCTVSGNYAHFGGGMENYGTAMLTNCTVSGNYAYFGGVAASFGGGIANYGTATLTNCTVSGNFASFGGGVENYGTATLTNCTISGNYAFFGGGVENFGTATLTHCTVSGNAALDTGGGLDNTFGTLLLTDCTISGNAAYFGGGLYNSGMATLTNCTVSGNAAYFGGGVDNLGTATLTNCTVSGNYGYIGGGVANYGGTATLTGCTVSGNYGYIGGGVENYGTAMLTDCTVSGNSASESGGGLDNSGGTATLTGCTVSGNSAGIGGGISNQGTLIVASSTINSNKATSAGGGISTTGGSVTITGSAINSNRVDALFIALGGGIDCENSTLSLTNCTVNANQANGATALGGGIYALESTVSLKNSAVNGNKAKGTVDGEGGGIYSLDSILTLIASNVKGNKASTAFDDIFSGP